MLKIFPFLSFIVGIMLYVGLGCGTDDGPMFDAGADADTDGDGDADSDTDADSDSDTDGDSDKECVPAQCCHPTSCVEKAKAPDCSETGCDASCQPGTLDCGQGFCDDTGGKCAAVIVSELTCGERVQKSNAEIKAVADENVACEKDEECTTIGFGTDCVGGCPMAVAKSGVSAVQAAIDEANGKYCQSYQEDGCPYMTPGCLAPEPACRNKQCVAY